MTEQQPAGSGGDGNDYRKDPFVTYIAELDPGAKAALRRSLAFPPGTWPGGFPYVEPWVSRSSRWERQVTYLVAGLQAQSRTEGGYGNLGEAIRRLSDATDSRSIEARFLALLDADGEQLPHRLRQMTTLLSSHDIAPDWGRLRRDLVWWRTPDRDVQQRWARSFYQEKRASGESQEAGDDVQTSEVRAGEVPHRMEERER